MGTLKINQATVNFMTSSIVVIGVFVIYQLRKRYNYWNNEFKEVGSVKDLFLYPIKSAKSMNVEWMDCLKNGSQFKGNKDRHFLIVDENADHLFFRGKQYPKMVLIESQVIDDILIIKTPNGNSVKVNLKDVENRNDVRNAM
uniref:Molybdenum cofactor sulfurase middle domain-containing protein n=1 Tax=Panagrolaimus sp. ES5 TaxID=591445 RepID=A0AC34GWF3_9BILA